MRRRPRRRRAPAIARSEAWTKRNDAWNDSSPARRRDVGGCVPSDVQGPEPISLSIAIRQGGTWGHRGAVVRSSGRNIVAVTGARAAGRSPSTSLLCLSWNRPGLRLGGNRPGANLEPRSQALLMPQGVRPRGAAVGGHCNHVTVVFAMAFARHRQDFSPNRYFADYSAVACSDGDDPADRATPPPRDEPSARRLLGYTSDPPN